MQDKIIRAKYTSMALLLFFVGNLSERIKEARNWITLFCLSLVKSERLVKSVPNYPGIVLDTFMI